MDAANILVAGLSAGVVALLVWFEVNSRQNEARKKRELELSHQAERDRQAMEAKTDNRKAA